MYSKDQSDEIELDLDIKPISSDIIDNSSLETQITAFASKINENSIKINDKTEKTDNDDSKNPQQLSNPLQIANKSEKITDLSPSVNVYNTLPKAEPLYEICHKEFIARQQWEMEIELWRAYLLDLARTGEPDVYRFTSEINIDSTLTFKILKKEISSYYFECKLSFGNAFRSFGLTPLLNYKSLPSLYTHIIEFLIQGEKLKLKEAIKPSDETATIEFINDLIKPNKKCALIFKKIYVRPRTMDENIALYLAEIDRKLTMLKKQNRIFFEIEDGPRRNPTVYNFFREPEEIKAETERRIKKQLEVEEMRKKEAEMEKKKTPLQKINEKLKTDIKINDKKVTIKKEFFNNSYFKLFSKINFSNLEILELSSTYISELELLNQEQFKNLKVLYLHTQLRDISFFEKAPFTELENLSLIENKFNSVEALAKAPFAKNLKKLDLYKNGINNFEGFGKGNFEKLESLILSDNNLKNINGTNNDTFKVLTDIKLEENQLENIVGFENFPKYFFENITSLELQSNKIRNIDILSSFEFNNLKQLNLNNNKIIDIKCLENLKAKNLAELYLNHNFLKDFNSLEKMNFPDLKVLQITDNPDVKKFQPLSNLPFTKLEKLYLCGYFELKDISFLKLKTFEHLKVLSLTRNRIESIAILKDCTFKNLTYLSMEENIIKDISPLTEVCFKDLEELYMDRNKIDSIQCLERVPFVNIKRINFMNNTFCKITVLDSLKFKKLKSISLQGGNVYLYDEENRIAKERFKWKYPDCNLYV